ncbi:MAG: hypothetical protein R3F49_12665 [Planctomycetota bacterium]
MHTCHSLASLALAASVCALPVSAQGLPRVAIAAAEANNLQDCRYTDLQQKLQQTGRFAVVDVIDVKTVTPSLATLQGYAAVLTWSNEPYENSSDLGDKLADYVDGGGGVVVAGFANYTTMPGLFLTGRWLSGGYEVIAHTAGLQPGTANLGAVLEPTHPIAQNVSVVTGMFMGRPFLNATFALTQGRVILEWDDGRMLAAVSDTMPRRVDLGLYPVGTDCVPGFLEATSDGATLIANALHFAATGGTIATSYCTAATNSSGSSARILVSGSDFVADNDVTLRATGLPQNSFGFFLCSQTQGFLANPGGSQGNLCIQGSLGRFQQQIQSSGSTGVFSIQPDLTALPTPTGTVAGAVGETWNFQAWFRDANPQLTSNFTDGAALTLR